MEIKNKSKLPRLTMLLVALLVLVGASYAYFDYLFIGKDNTISTTDVSIKLLESNKEIITLENQLPISDEQGMVQEGTGNVFDFAVETKSSSDMKLGYKLSIEKLQTDTGYTSLTDDQIKIYLTDTDNNKILGPLKISELDNYNLYEDVNIHSKTNNTQVDKYRIRVWIDQDVQVKEWNENTKQQYKFKIGVGSTENEGSYIITYSPNGGEGQMAASVYNQNTTNNLRKNTFTRGGYTFKGWSTTNNGEVEYQDQNTATNLTTSQNEQNRTLYAVWQPNTYTVKYHPNGGIDKTEEPLVLDVDYYPWDGENTDKWSLVNGVYESKNQDTTSSAEQTSYSKTSNVKPLATQYIYSYMYKEINLSEDTQLQFDYAMEYGTIFIIAVAKDESQYETIDNIFQGTETKSTYNTKSITLPKGNYYLKLGYTDNPYFGVAPASYKQDNKSYPIIKKLETTEVEHKAYIKNIHLTIYNSNKIESSKFTVGQNNKLKTNNSTKKGYTFKGWNTNKNETEIQYTSESDLTNLESKVKEQEQIDLYAIWEINKYNVNVVVQNGTINGDSTKQVGYNQNGTFNLTSTTDSKYASVRCTNNQKGIVENGVLTIKNVTDNTTCTVKYNESAITTLYNDGTLIINENTSERNDNITKHGEVQKEYEAMSDSNSYTFEYEQKENDSYLPNTLWISEVESIRSIEIGQYIKPVSTGLWFASMVYLEKTDFTNLDTSDTINMHEMFLYTSAHVKNFSLDLSGLNTSKVTNMINMFRGAGYESTTFDLNLSEWDTSNVVVMESMFDSAGYSATTWNIKGIQNWNTSKVTSMWRVFASAGFYSRTFKLNLSNWNTSSVTVMGGMFYKAGYSATTFNLNLSNWNTSSVSNMGSMFDSAGSKATTWSVTIPNTTGSLTNTTSKWYGSGESVYAIPNSGESFTLAS